jgi:CelD/BcsL family acetyltransferase involved in cellulose biosynthesis
VVVVGTVTEPDAAIAIAAERPAPVAVEVDSLDPGAWDRLVGAFDDGSLEQSAAWTDGVWGARRTSHLLLRRGPVPIAGARVVILPVPGVGRGVAWVKFGPFWRRRDAPADPASHALAAAALVDEYCVRRGHCLTILPRPTPERADEEARTLASLGFVRRRRMADPNRYVVDVALDPEARLPRLDQKWRYNLRRAMRGGIECRVVDAPRGPAIFGELHARMIARKPQADVDPLEVLPALGRRLAERMRPRFVLAFHGGTPVAGAVVAVCGDTAFYVFGASDAAALPLRAGYVLQWWIVGWLAGLGVRWYDLGGEAGDAGLRQFKSGLVGTAGVVVRMPGELDRWTRLPGRLAADCVFALRGLKRVVRSARPWTGDGDGAARR